MSHIAFNTELHERVLLGGSERYHMQAIIAGCMELAVRELTPRVIVERANPEHYVAAAARKVIAGGDNYGARKAFEETLSTCIRVGDIGGGGELFPGVDLFTASLNTAIALGSDPVKLAARIHGQCEIHLWFAAADAPFIADIMAQGLAIGIYRAGMGWDKVIDLLRLPDVGDVVLSYSVTESFPDSYIAIDDRLSPPIDWTDSKGWDAARREAADVEHETREQVWDEMSDDEQWNAAMRGLRAKGGGLQMTRADFEDGFHFHDGRNGFTMLASGDGHD